MNLKTFMMVAGLVGAGIGSAQASSLTLAEATGFNVFVFSNLTGTSDAQGAVAVGGNFTPGSNGFTVGAQSAASPGGYSLVVGGNFSESYNTAGTGNIYVGGNMNWTGPTISNNAYVAGNFTNSGYGSVGGTIYYGGTYSSAGTLSHVSEPASTIRAGAPVSFSSALTDLNSLSLALAGYTANGTVASSYGSYTLTGTSSDINVFNLSSLSVSGGSVTINAPAGSTVIINVSGSSDSFSNGQINLNGVTTNDVIWNFEQATSLSMSSFGFYGTVLAAEADYIGNYGQINGQFIGNSIAGTTQFNEALFSGNLGSGGLGSGGGSQGSATPEPSTWLMMLTAIGALIVVPMKRRHAAVTVTSSADSKRQ